MLRTLHLPVGAGGVGGAGGNSGNGGTRATGRARVRDPGRPAMVRQAFSTCEKSSSTGVERPKIDTATRNLFFS
jgi:hypothetical protein